MEKQTLSSPYVIIVPLLLDPSEYNLVQRPVPVHHQYAQRLMMPESGITPTVSSDCHDKFVPPKICSPGTNFSINMDPPELNFQKKYEKFVPH